MDLAYKYRNSNKPKDNVHLGDADFARRRAQARDDSLARDTHRRSLELQRTKNEGSLSIQDRAETGSTNRFKIGDAFKRDNLASLNKNADRTFGLDRETQRADQFNTMFGRSLGRKSELGTVVPGVPMKDQQAAYSNFNNDPNSSGVNISSEALKRIEGSGAPAGGGQAAVTTASGKRFDQQGNELPKTPDARGNIIQPEQAPPPVFTFKAPGDRKVSTYVEQAPTQKSRSASEFERMGRVLNSPESMFVDTFFPKKKRAPKKTSVYGVKTNRML